MSVKSLPLLICLAATATAGRAADAPRSGPAAPATERVQSLRVQVEQNDQLIREMEARLRALQARRDRLRPGTAPGGTAAPAGEISAWSSRPATAAPSFGPAASRHTAPSGAASSAPAIGEASSGSSIAPESAASPSVATTARRAKALAAVRLKRGWTAARVFDLFGPPEFVRGRRDSVMYWHYGPGWVRFQEGRVTSWTVTRQAHRS